MKQYLLQPTSPPWSWRYLVGFILLICLAFGSVNRLAAQTVRVTGTENNVNIQKLKLRMGSERFEQLSPTGNSNPTPDDVPVLIESVFLESGEEIFVTSRRPKIVNPNPVLGTEEISPGAVEIINS